MPQVAFHSDHILFLAVVAGASWCRSHWTEAMKVPSKREVQEGVQATTEEAMHVE